jgi:transcriptional regulator with XRE-family HTH domain
MEERRRFDPARLVAARRAKGFTQRALAAQASVSQALIAELERGKRSPSKLSIEKIASSLGILATALFEQ